MEYKLPKEFKKNIVSILLDEMLLIKLLLTIVSSVGIFLIMFPSLLLKIIRSFFSFEANILLSIILMFDLNGFL